MELNPSKARTSETAREILLEFFMRLPDPERADENLEQEDPESRGHVTESVLKERLLEAIKSRNLPSQRLVIKSGTRMLFLQPEKIEWVEAEKDYVRLHVGKETHLVRETMNSFEKKLESRQFVRVHRSTIVNLDYVKEMKPLPSGEYDIMMRDGTPLRLSRGYRPRLIDLLRDSF